MAPIVQGLAPGARLGHYEVVSPLGFGGMGEVYRARDPRLDREVALKVLRLQLVQDEAARARFEREAKAVAALSHPNILAIYDIGVDEGTPFTVTELLEGETLRARLASGPQPWKSAVAIATSIADGLAAAHARGIIHRDIKPENVFLTHDGRVKILDFGLARSQESSGPTGAPTVTVIATKSGLAVGTPGYMAPEQVFGEALDASADVFSLGCVLYEMLSGRRPFDRDTPAETFGAILYASPPALGESGLEVPPALERVVGHCLEKLPLRRFRSARDVASALCALSLDSSATSPAGVVGRSRSRGPRQRSLAVLPFAASGDAADLACLGEGIAEGVINALAGMKGVRVIPRTLSFRHAGREGEPRTLGVELNAETLLSGRITVRGDQLQIQAELVDTSDESQIWGSRFVRLAGDLEIVSRLLADEARDALTGRRRTSRNTPTTRARKTDSTAYQEYLRGRYHWNRWTRGGLLQAIDAFKASATADPTYAPAFAGLADAYGAAGFYGYLPVAEAMPRAHDAAELAVKLDPSLAEAHAVLGVEAMFFRWEWAAAERHLARALELNDHSLTALVYYALFLACRGRGEESLEHARRAERADPLSLLALSSVAWGRLHTGDIEGAEAQLHRMLGIEPEFPEALQVLAQLAEARDDFASAVGYHRRWFPSMGLRAEDADRLWAGFEEGGREGYWRASLQVLAGADASCPSTPVAAAAIRVKIGDVDGAIAELERAVEMRVPMLAFLGVDVQFVALRGDPRFSRILARVGVD